jgi:hypothetical protein
MGILSLVALTVLGGLQTAGAKPLPLTVGGQLGYRSVHELRLMGQVQWACTDTFSLRVIGGPRLLAGPVKGTVAAGPVASFDVYTWVPSLYLLGGISAQDVRPLVQMGAEVKRYLSMHTGMTMGVAGEWIGKSDFGVFVSLGASYTL